MSEVDIYSAGANDWINHNKAERELEIQESKKLQKQKEIDFINQYPVFKKEVLSPIYGELAIELGGYVITDPCVIRLIVLWGNQHIHSIVQNYKPEVSEIFMFELVKGQRVFVYVKQYGHPCYGMHFLDGNWSQFYMYHLIADELSSGMIKDGIFKFTKKHYPVFL